MKFQKDTWKDLQVSKDKIIERIPWMESTREYDEAFVVSIFEQFIQNFDLVIKLQGEKEQMELRILDLEDKLRLA